MKQKWLISITAVITLLLLGGCGAAKSATVSLNYDGLSAQAIAENPLFITCNEPALAYVEEEKVEVDWLIYSAYKQGFLPVGESQFTAAGRASPASRRAHAIALAKERGVCLIYWSHNFSHTSSSTQNYSYEAVVGMVPSGSGGASIPITQTQQGSTTQTWDNYRSAFYFFAKLNPDEDFGTFFKPITDAGKLQSLGVKSALYIMHVRPESEASRIGFRSTDIILGLDKQQPCTAETFHSTCIQKNVYTVYRENKRITLRK